MMLRYKHSDRSTETISGASVNKNTGVSLFNPQITKSSAPKIVKAEPGHFAQIRDLLVFLPHLYPAGDAWLERKLKEVSKDQALCHVAIFNSEVVAIAIETPKGQRTKKLSTFFVDENVRTIGIGSHLLMSRIASWKDSGQHNIYVTVASTKISLIGPLLHQNNFYFEGEGIDRYGSGRDELVYTWKP